MPCISTILAYLLSWPSTENVDQDRYESPRVLWRLNTLRGLSHDEVKQVFT